MLRSLFAGFVLLVSVAASAQLSTGTLEPGQADVVVTSGLAAAAATPTSWDSPEIEARGIWIDSKELMSSRDALTSKLDLLKRANYNTVMVDSWFRGYAAYPGSQYAPIYPGMKQPDTFAWVIREIKKRGMRAEVWPSYGFYAYYTQDARKDKSAGPLLDAHPELTAVDSSGTRYLHNPSLGDFYSLCPANPASHELLAMMITEAVTKFDADGLNMDRMRFPAENFCYCKHCQESFARDTGIVLRVFPRGSMEADRFLQWKRLQNAKGVGAVSAMVRRVRPGLPITSYVVGPEEMNSKAQSWDLWIQRGYVDAVAVSMYGANVEGSARRALQLLGGNSRKLIYAISCEHATPLFLRNILVSRTMGGLGQYTWYSGAVGDDIEALREGPYRRTSAFPPLPLP